MPATCAVTSSACSNSVCGYAENNINSCLLQLFTHSTPFVINKTPSTRLEYTRGGGTCMRAPWDNRAEQTNRHQLHTGFCWQASPGACSGHVHGKHMKNKTCRGVCALQSTNTVHLESRKFAHTQKNACTVDLTSRQGSANRNINSSSNTRQQHTLICITHPCMCPNALFCCHAGNCTYGQTTRSEYSVRVLGAVPTQAARMPVCLPVCKEGMGAPTLVHQQTSCHPASSDKAE